MKDIHVEVLNMLTEPKSVQELIKLMDSKLLVKTRLFLLHRILRFLVLHKYIRKTNNTHTTNYTNKAYLNTIYISLTTTKWKGCTICGRLIEDVSKYRTICYECQENLASSPAMDRNLSMVSFNHMQSTINELKQTNYKLAVENHSLKKELQTLYKTINNDTL